MLIGAERICVFVPEIPTSVPWKPPRNDKWARLFGKLEFV